ncbi:hypothetical protein [Brevibacillus parabrevis]|uniref:Uncharacterized protein n=1 Tax=Brevibacillus parabrevis TaxID=54914 RepID=A0A4Y3PWU2_BREPA|nr:hypothetical protein [Brevibacillus parabrevis]RNB94413.1 hypothetical protein EDM60_18665 [Brevibacillus parabrevis]GEB35281.1 hypothetical protein BPA01_48610 [Brevibacillus parabrevis]
MNFYITPEEYEQAARDGVRPALLEVRIRMLAWPKDRAIKTPPHKKNPLKDWVEVAKHHGICYSTLRYRANRLGWELERAATQPLQDRKAQAKRAYESSRKYPEKYLRMAEQNGIKERTFHRRVKSGWDIEIAATRPPMTARECGLLSKAKSKKWLKRLFLQRKGS